MKNWKFMKSGGVLLICGMVMSSTSAIAMTLDEYLAQVRGNNNAIPTYIVKADGTIDFPILGSLDTKEKTVEQFSNYIKQRMTDL